MSQDKLKKSGMTDEEVRQLAADSDTGGRKPTGLSAKVVMYAALAWSAFQLWIASPLPFSLGIFVLNDTQSRAIHLAFAVFLGYLLFPPLKSSPRKYIPVQDWVLALFRPEFAQEGGAALRILAMTTAFTVLFSLAPTYLKYQKRDRITYAVVAGAAAMIAEASG